jgi:hypothetical protein
MAGAIAVLSEFMKKDMTRIRNKSAFVNGIIDRVQKELAHDKVMGAPRPYLLDFSATSLSLVPGARYKRNK